MKFPKISDPAAFARHFRDAFWRDFAAAICRKHNVPFQYLNRAEHGENIVFLVDAAFVIKIYTPFRNGFRREKTALEFAGNKTSLIIPEILFEGRIANFDYLVTTQLPGGLMLRETWKNLKKSQQAEILSQLARGLKQLHSQRAETIDFSWQTFIKNQVETVYERQRADNAKPEWLVRLPSYLEESLGLLPPDFSPAFLHGDVHFGNLRVIEKDGKWRISGLFDFADFLKGFYEYEFVAVGVLMIQGQGELQREFFQAYGYRKSEIDEAFRRRLMLLTILYECSSLRKYALRLKPEALDLTLDELERAIWNFI